MRKIVSKYQEKVLESENDNTAYQIMRYACAGFLAVIIDFVLLHALTEFLHIHYWFSSGLSYIASTLINYFVTTRFVFARQNHTKETTMFQIFFIIGLIGLGLNQVLMYSITEFVNLDYLTRISSSYGLHVRKYIWAKVIAGSTVFLWNFVAKRHAVHKKLI